MPATTRARRIRLLPTALAAVLAAVLLPTTAIVGAAATPTRAVAPVAHPGRHHHVRPAVLSGSQHRSWRVDASPDPHPLRHPEGPAVHANPQPLHACPAKQGGSATGGPAGEGVLTLRMSAPHTTWASKKDTSVVVDVSVDTGGQQTSKQQIVLFDGAHPFRYEAFVGQLRSGSHCVTVRVDPGRSSDKRRPVVDVDDARLRITPRSSADYQAMTHAPVMYARSTSEAHDAMLLTDVTATPDADEPGDTDLAYTVIWTREDVGDGQFPFYEWGNFGRMTDVETVLRETVAPGGRIVSANYLSCGCEDDPGYPDDQNAPAGPTTETDQPYPSTGTPPALDRHLVLRDATGNNDESPYGTTRYRMQQVPLPGPRPGQVREIVMDRHPWTYQLSNEDVTRSSPDVSKNPANLSPGVYPQYLVVDADVDVSGTSSVSIGVQIAGDQTWYTNDYQQSPSPTTAAAFYNGGHGRTVIKLPVGWHSHRITALRLTLNPATGATPAVNGTPELRLIEVTPSYQIVHRPVPTPTVVTASG